MFFSPTKIMNTNYILLWGSLIHDIGTKGSSNTKGFRIPGFLDYSIGLKLEWHIIPFWKVPFLLTNESIWVRKSLITGKKLVYKKCPQSYYASCVIFTINKLFPPGSKEVFYNKYCFKFAFFFLAVCSFHKRVCYRSTDKLACLCF